MVHTRQGRLLGLLVACLTASCGESPTTEPPPPGPTGVLRTDPLAVHVEGRSFRDGRGRQLLFRGYNAKKHGLFDVSFDDGRRANYEYVDFNEAEAQRFEELGWNVIRLPVNWSALEPQPGQYSATFLAKLDETLALAARHHFYVVVDMHQDGYSKEIGEDGAPLWAIVPPPTMLLEGPSSDDRRTSEQVVQAGLSFFANVPATDGRPLEDAFFAAVEQMVRRTLGHARVLGWEAFNEPVIFNQQALDDFHVRFAEHVHAIDRDAPVLFEPYGFRNQADEAPLAWEPWSSGPGAYAPHVYSGQFNLAGGEGWSSEDPEALRPGMESAEAEAKSWGTPLFVGEYGCNVAEPRGVKWMAAEGALQDELLASSTAWGREWGSWGLSDDAGVERADLVHVVARSYPRAIAGDLLAIERPEPGHLVIRWRETDRTRGLAHEVSMSDAYATGWEVRCDGVPVEVTRAPGRGEFVCPPSGGTAERVIDVVGTPVP
jgi:endoglycosylceramidase